MENQSHVPGRRSDIRAALHSAINRIRSTGSAYFNSFDSLIAAWPIFVMSFPMNGIEAATRELSPRPSRPLPNGRHGAAEDEEPRSAGRAAKYAQLWTEFSRVAVRANFEERLAFSFTAFGA